MSYDGFDLVILLHLQMCAEESSQAKRLKVDVESTTESADPSSSPIVISEALAKFLGTGGREMIQSEAIRHVWEYIKVNHLEVGSMWHKSMPSFFFSSKFTT